ncbi:CRISPR-associated protein Cas4 [Natrarchaeobaculum aegyptiacum]|uniref:Dna2/Cas4 domain-containing protein n=1 Tax=Natrarchaeobaculum aegyptiacum TaxID=745377 RepID=A0A2Z2HT90_9EURY|nr:PD-(D/E)XK nuclease family protein [Natrarchaeobaculum aegyptiacum]ARS89335.1 Dna2/Cas4 domain-containing protein [Natrarchaeobaculum aegyptiacum]
MGEGDSEEEHQMPVGNLVNEISGERFRDWYREREFRRNIEDGKPYFNGPSPVPSPRKHSPGQLLQCHRKIAYRQHNAPAEKPDPAGIFWFGSQFEEDLVLTFLREAVVDNHEYVSNSLWVDFTVQTDTGKIQIKGETDPVIVDSDGEPLLLTEIKTKQSVDNVRSPNRHHRAQAHAYMKGLSEKHNRKVTEAVVLYGSRETLNVKAFHIEFDPWFWRNTVLAWTETHTSYRLDEELPPANPEYGWECSVCSFRDRCGQGNATYESVDSVGLLPLHEYPREEAIRHLESHEDAKLTPTLSDQYPELADRFEVHDWRCERCDKSYPYDSVDWTGDLSEPPLCPSCCNNEVPATLRGDSIPTQGTGGDSRVTE